MNSKSRKLAVLAVIAIAAAGGIFWRMTRSLPASDLLKRLPSANSIVLYVDFDALRRAGLLQILDGSKTGQDPEYKSFVASTGFNYARDLDIAAVAFAPTGKYLLVRGRFDWPKLEAYVRSQQGQCADSICRMVGSTPERRISFFPLRSSVMAMAVSSDDFAVRRLATAGSGPDLPVPQAPLWLSIPPSVLRSGDNLPEGTRMFARSMDRADSVSLEFAPEGQRLAARLNVLCSNDQDAAEVATQLGRITSLLRDMIQREHQTPNSADLSGVLTSGSFRAEGRRVHGYWPIERKFVENMLGGGA